VREARWLLGLALACGPPDSSAPALKGALGLCERLPAASDTGDSSSRGCEAGAEGGAEQGPLGAYAEALKASVLKDQGPKEGRDARRPRAKRPAQQPGGDGSLGLGICGPAEDGAAPLQEEASVMERQPRAAVAVASVAWAAAMAGLVVGVGVGIAAGRRWGR
jgi:hypothetical protein